MKPTVSRSCLVLDRKVILGAAAVMLCCVGVRSMAATVVAGLITDAFSGGAVAGAEVTVKEGGTTLGSGTSDATGKFRVVFDLLGQISIRNLKMDVRMSGYTDVDKDVIVSGGRTDQDSYRVSLIATDISACRRTGNHLVVVGYFRPPSGMSGDPQLADRIKDSLDYDILARFQKLKIGPQAQPVILACEKMKPEAMVDYGNYAKVLGADAFLSGYVAPSGTAGLQKVKVDVSIADQFGVLAPPAHATALDVDLDDPATTRLQGDAQAAIFTALVIGYERGVQFNECIAAANAAEQLLGKLPAVMADARKRCMHSLPNAGLLR